MVKNVSYMVSEKSEVTHVSEKCTNKAHKSGPALSVLYKIDEKYKVFPKADTLEIS